MRITIDTRVLAKNNITLGQFTTLLLGYFGCSYNNCFEALMDKGLADTDVIHNDGMVLSGNSKDLVARILTESDEKVRNTNIDFYELAERMMQLYPKGVKSGTTYQWRGTVEEIAYKLMVLIAVHNFTYTEQEAIDATKEYVDSFKESDNLNQMKLLKYFILRTKDGDITSDFMTIIENNRWSKMNLK